MRVGIVDTGDTEKITQSEIRAVYIKQALRDGLKKYLEIMDVLHRVNVAEHKEFQKKYNHFYRMRQRKPEYYQMYYDYMQEMKKNKELLSFEDVFFHIQKKTGRCEVSFSSKLLATINPNKPVWDSFVLENLGIKKVYPTTKDREKKIVAAYHQICDWYGQFMQTEEADLIIEVFDEIYPDTNITNLKKIDLFLWQNRK